MTRPQRTIQTTPANSTPNDWLDGFILGRQINGHAPGWQPPTLKATPPKLHHPPLKRLRYR